MNYILLWWILSASSYANAEEKTCSWGEENCFTELHIKPMTFDLGNGNETFWAYVTPDVSTYYQQVSGPKKAVKPHFNGKFAKFINLSPKIIRLYWCVSSHRH